MKVMAMPLCILICGTSYMYIASAILTAQASMRCEVGAEMNRHIRANYPDFANYTANYSANYAHSKPKKELKRLESGIIFANELDIIGHLIGKGKVKENYDNLIGVKMTDDWMYKEAFIEQYHQHYHHDDIQIYYRDNGFFIAHYLMRGMGGKGVVSIKRRMFYFDGDILKQIPEANGKGRTGRGKHYWMNHLALVLGHSVFTMW